MEPIRQPGYVGRRVVVWTSITAAGSRGWSLIVIDLSQYRLETLHQDGEFILYRGRCETAETSPPSILVLSPVMDRPASATLRKIKQEFSFRDELNPAW